MVISGISNPSIENPNAATAVLRGSSLEVHFRQHRLNVNVNESCVSVFFIKKINGSVSANDLPRVVRLQILPHGSETLLWACFPTPLPSQTWRKKFSPPPQMAGGKIPGGMRPGHFGRGG